MTNNYPQLSRFDAWQERNEQRSEAHSRYGERAAQFLTTLGTKSISGVISSADEQADAARRLDEI